MCAYPTLVETYIVSDQVLTLWKTTLSCFHRYLRTSHPCMSFVCRLHPIPDHHQPLWWQQVNSEIEIEWTWKCGVATCSLPPCSPTAIQLAAMSPHTPHFLRCLHSLGEFCIPFGAQEPIPAEWTSSPDWKYPRDPKFHRSAYFSCSIKKREGKKWEYSPFLSACFSNRLYLCVLHTKKLSLLCKSL